MQASGDLPSAAKNAKKALQLDPNLYPALDLLAEIYFRSDQYEIALSYLNQMRKYPEVLSTEYNLGLANLKLGRKQEALRHFRDFLEATGSSPVREWKRMRESARNCATIWQAGRAPAAKPPTTTARRVAPAASPAPARPPQPPPPRTSVEFLPAPPLAFSQPGGTLADYLLHRRLLELRITQNFEDLLCLPSLHGVDAYVYQQETVRKVLRHFKGRALLADEVGLGKTIEACLVLKEYWMRGLVRKALVLTPPSLVSQWKGELIEKFGLAPVSPDDAEFRRDPARSSGGEDRWWSPPSPWPGSTRTPPTSPRVAWDMVIVDEAHCLKNRTSANWQAGGLAAEEVHPDADRHAGGEQPARAVQPDHAAQARPARHRGRIPQELRDAGQAEVAARIPSNCARMLGDVMIRNTRAAADVQLPRRIAASVAVPPSQTEAAALRHGVAVRGRNGTGKEAKGGAAGWRST